MATLTIQPIGTLTTPFKERFGIPRQAVLIKEAQGVLKLEPVPAYRQAVRHLETFSHIWLVFGFHGNPGSSWHALVDTPRLAEGRKVGVFATRSPHRPNPLGMSAVKLERIDLDAPGGIEIHVSGLDILDGTPVYDVKPYLPYADSIPGATAGWASAEIARHPVGFAPECRALLAEIEASQYPRLTELIEQMLALDPRPSSRRLTSPLGSPEAEGQSYAFRVLDLDVHWRVEGGALLVYRLDDLRGARPG